MADSEPATPPADLVFGHYRVLRRPDGSLWELGRGSMGVTYKAFDEQLRVDVALKIIAPSQVNDDKIQALFLREARAAARVHHPNVASVVYLNTAPGNFYYAMEFISGESLQHWLRNRGALAPGLALAFATQMARGLEAIHAQQIVHRDLKPSNVMIVPTGRKSGATATEIDPEAWRIKIIDFGLARPFGGGSLDSVAQAPTTGFRGTALYASPEQCQERDDIDGRSDQYSLGCILFEMLTGTPPFRGRSHHELLNQHVYQPPPLERLQGLAPSLREVVARLLAKEPADRFADADAAAAALETCRRRIENGEEPMGEVDATIVADHSIPSARPPTSPISPAARSPFSSKRLLLAGSAAVLIALGIWRLSRAPGTGASPSAVSPSPVPAATPAAKEALSRKAIAILPFENRSAEKENEYLTDGIHEDVLTNLARLQDLKVVSRGAVMAYKPGANRDLAQISRELGVGSVLEGSVQRSGKRIRVTTQLVDPVTKTSVWANTYDRELTDILEIQTQIAQEIAKALAANLSASEAAQIAKPPTGNPSAYDEYLRGREIVDRDGWNRTGNEAAIGHFKRATELDPEFALAFAELGDRYAISFISGWDASDARAEMARAAVERARALQPDSPRAVAAYAGYLFRVEQRHEEALQILRQAESKNPDDVDLLMAIGNLLRRRDRMDDALAYFRKAERLAPKNPDPLGYQAAVLYWLRRFEEQERVMQRLLVLSPAPEGEEYIAMARAIQVNDWPGYVRELQRLDPRLTPERRARYRFLRRDFKGALEALGEVKGQMVGSNQKSILKAENYLKLGNREAALAEFSEAEIALRKMVEAGPRDRNARLNLAYACIMLGKREEGMRLAEGVVAEAPESADVVEGRDIASFFADLCALSGDFDRAVQIYRRLLEVPSSMTRFTLRNDPFYEDFKRNPAFAALAAEPGP